LIAPYVSGVEAGRRNPTYLNLLRMAKALGGLLTDYLVDARGHDAVRSGCENEPLETA
jgi:hypothetical protein